MSASPAVRGLRAAVFAAVCVLLAAAGHGMAMGDMPPLWADGLGFLAVFALGSALGGRERSLPGIGAAMLLTQAGLHLGFGAAHQSHSGTGLAGMPAVSGLAGMPALPGHAMVGMSGHLLSGHAMAGMTGYPMAGMSGHPMAAMAAMPGMQGAAVHGHTVAHATVAHLLAALVAAWWLRRGEAALWSLLRRTAALVPGLVAWWRDAPLPTPAGPVLPVQAGPEPPRKVPLRHAVTRRGPPAPIPYSL
jgi:hypothetical protein